MKGTAIVHPSLLAMLAVFWALTSSAQLVDSPWPMYHGDARHSGQSAYSGPKTGTWAWTYDLVSYQTSSPVIDSYGTVYINCASNLYAIDSGGCLSWSYECGNFESCPAIGIDGTVYNGGNKTFYAFSSTGSLLWSCPMDSGIDGSPCIDSDGRLYVRTYFGLNALTSSGSKLWDMSLPGSESSPAVGPDGNIYIGGLRALTREGVFLWTYYAGRYFYSSPAIGTDGTIYTSGSYDTPALHAFQPSGLMLWSYGAIGSTRTSPSVGYDGKIYIKSEDRLLCLNPACSLAWSYNNNANPAYVEYPCIGSDGSVYDRGSKDILYSFSSSGKPLWAYFGLCSSPPSSPALGSDGRLYVVFHGGYRPGAREPGLLICFKDNATHVPNYINLKVSPPLVPSADELTLSWSCDFTRWDYQNTPVDVYLAAIIWPFVAERALSVEETLQKSCWGNWILFFGEDAKRAYLYDGTIPGPTFRNVIFRAGASGSLRLHPKFPDEVKHGLTQQCIFAVALVHSGSGRFIRTDGKPVEGSNCFYVQR